VKLAALALLLGLVAACPGTRSYGGPGPDTAVITVTCPVADATIWLDDRMIAQVRDARGGIRVKAGAHRVEIRHDRYHTRYYELSLKRGESRTLSVDLVEILD
jgi:hypothetical protein